MNLYILPSKNKNNIYIQLLIDSLKRRGEGVNVCYAKNDSLWSIFCDIASRKVRGDKNIIHIQWSTTLYGSVFIFKSVLLLVINTLIIFVLRNFFGTKFVWTVHNFSAHDYDHEIIDRIGRRLLILFVDAIVTQQKETFNDYLKRYPNKNIKYIPHGNYIDAYGPKSSRDFKLRQSFGFKDDDLVLISLGAIKKYKLNEQIISAVIWARKNNQKLKLLIIGKGSDGYIDQLKSLIREVDGIVVSNSFVSNVDIPRYLSIADYSIFYYDKSEMTSGGIILSLSYGVPVISRNIPGAEMINRKSGFVYDNIDQLKDILSSIGTDKISDFDDDIIGSVKGDSWDHVASSLLGIYKNI